MLLHPLKHQLAIVIHARYPSISTTFTLPFDRQNTFETRLECLDLPPDVVLVVHALVDEAEAPEEARVNHEGRDLRVQP
jgi:hypothetical protein